MYFINFENHGSLTICHVKNMSKHTKTVLNRKLLSWYTVAYSYFNKPLGFLSTYSPETDLVYIIYTGGGSGGGEAGGGALPLQL